MDIRYYKKFIYDKNLSDEVINNIDTKIHKQISDILFLSDSLEPKGMLKKETLEQSILIRDGYTLI